MNPQIKKRLLRTFILCLIAFGIGAALGLFQVREQGVPVATQSPPPGVAGASIGGAFEALDQDGEAVNESVLLGNYSLVYFGFTYCPAICPTELQKITRVLNTLQEDAPDIAAQIKPVFITVDPERDTPEVLKDYISLFHPRLIGITGSEAQIDHIKDIYKIYARKVPLEGGAADEYTVDHSSYIYFLDPQGALLSLYRVEDDAAHMITDIKAHMNAR